MFFVRLYNEFWHMHKILNHTQKAIKGIISSIYSRQHEWLLLLFLVYEIINMESVCQFTVYLVNWVILLHAIISQIFSILFSWGGRMKHFWKGQEIENCKGCFIKGSNKTLWEIKAFSFTVFSERKIIDCVDHLPVKHITKKMMKNH